MRKYIRNSVGKIATAVFIAFIMTACYTDTIDSFSKIKVQLPIFFHSNFFDKASPDTSVSFSNLYQYQEFIDNKDKIDKAEIYQFNYRVDSLKYSTAVENPKDQDSIFVFNPDKDTIVFEFIRFYVQYAKPKYDGVAFNDKDSSHWMPDPDAVPTLLGEFTDVDVRSYYRQSKNIQKVEEKVTEIITNIAKNRPQFYIMTEYGRMKGQTQPKRYFPLIYAYYDLILRMSVNL